MSTRSEIKNFILELESRFPVNSWTADGIHVWPVIRIRLFLGLLAAGNPEKLSEKPEEIVKASLVSKAKAQLKRKVRKIIIIAKYFLWLWQLPKKKYIFVAADAHRVDHKGKRYNRFFDVLIEAHNLGSDALYLEYDHLPVKNQYHVELVKKYHEAFMGYAFVRRKRTHKFEWAGYGDFLEYLARNNRTAPLAENYSVDRMERWFEGFSTKIDFFTAVLKRIQPNKVLILCYYLNDVMALTAAANRLGLNTAEMQHGPQSDVHLAYGNWSAVPLSGYDVLPRTYWSWDAGSKTVIDHWAEKNSLYTAKVIGNPWIDYWKKNRTSYPHSGFLLYSLQPSPVSISELFPDKLIDFIKQGGYKWFLRLHPRQMQERENIEDFLRRRGVLERTNIAEATADPLPLLLANAKAHITHFSGTTIEASLFDVFTVLINPIGVESFPELIAAGKAQYLDVSSDSFADEFVALIEASRATSTDGRNLSELAGQHLFD